MAWGVLQRTSEADLAVSVTGHLGSRRAAALRWNRVAGHGATTRGRIEGPRTVRHMLSNTQRVQRQREAAALVLRHAVREISHSLSVQVLSVSASR